MQIRLDSTIQELLDAGKISTRLYNCLLNAGLESLDDVANYANAPEELLKLKHFGKKCYTEIVPLMRAVCQEHEKMKLRTPQEEFDLLDKKIGTMLKKAYMVLCKEDNDVAAFFIKAYPSVAELHLTVMGDVDKMMTIYDGFSMALNVEIRGMYVTYIYDAIRQMTDAGLIGKHICNEYRKKYEYLSNNLRFFTYAEKAKHFMTVCAHNHMTKFYEQMLDNLSIRTKNFLQQHAPQYVDLLPYFEATQTEYLKLCPGQTMKNTLAEVYGLTQCLKKEFDSHWLMSDEEEHKKILIRDFPFLGEKEHETVADYYEKHGYNQDKGYPELPVFYILYHYMCTSQKRNDIVIRQHYGFIDGREQDINELTKSLDLSRERIRYFISNYSCAFADRLMLLNDREKYESLFMLPYVTEDTKEYLILKEQEHLNFGFRIFARLMQLADKKFEPETVGDVTVAINRRMIHAMNVCECAEKLKKAVYSKHTIDKLIDISMFLRKVKDKEMKHATELMAYIARNALHMEMPDGCNVKVYARKNDIAEKMYDILAQKGEPMSLEELFETFKKKYPNHKYKEAKQLRTGLLRHPNIKAIGKSSRYGLDSWEGVFYGSIRKLLENLLDESENPMHINELLEKVSKYYPKTNRASLISSMRYDASGRFVYFQKDYYGLKAKFYDASYVKPVAIKRYSFSNRLAKFCAFVDNNKRYPLYGYGNSEASLCRWLYNITNDLCEVKEEDLLKLADVLKHYEQNFIPRNAWEYHFYSNCQRVRTFVDDHHALPSSSNEPELYKWMIQSIIKRDHYNDHRKKYLTDLLEYIRSQGISISFSCTQ